MNASTTFGSKGGVWEAMVRESAGNVTDLRAIGARRPVRRRWLDAPVATVINPATEQTLAELEPADAEAADRAVRRARAAFPEWRAVSPADRARLLRRLATVVEEHAEEL